MSSEYIATDNIAVYKAEAALRDMGPQEYLSALLLDGPPGCGKTFLAKILAKRLGAKLVQFQFYPGCGKDDLILDTAMSKNGERAQGILITTMLMSQQRKVVLLLDELDKAQPSVDSFLLTFLNEGSLLVPQLGGEFVANKENLLVVITKNDDRQAGTALLRRCRVVQMKWPSIEVEMKIFRQKYPYLTDEACLSMIDSAARLRGHPDAKKAPATPELIRLIADILVLVNEGRTAQELGYYYVDSITPLIHDRQYIPDSPTYLGTRIKRAFEPLMPHFHAAEEQAKAAKAAKAQAAAAPTPAPVQQQPPPFAPIPVAPGPIPIPHQQPHAPQHPHPFQPQAA